MTRDELIAALLKVRKRHNHKNGEPIYTGDAHEEADSLLLEYINDAEVTKAYSDCSPFWYA